MTALFSDLSPSAREMLLGFSTGCACAATNLFLEPDRIVAVSLLFVGFMAMNLFFASWLMPEPEGHVLVPLKRWWQKHARPGRYGVPETGGEVRIIRSRSLRSNILFDLDGNCVGDESYVCGEWCRHSIDSDCRYRMPPIALWLTKLRKLGGLD